MDGKILLSLLCLVLAVSAFTLFVQNRTLQADQEHSLLLSKSTLALLKAMEVRCIAESTDYDAITGCIEPLLKVREFKEDSFKQPTKDASGYVVIMNTGATTYESGLFTFQFNREPTATGCSVPGAIGKGVTCRFDLPRACADGDVLEIFYPVNGNETRVFLKTC